MNVTVALPIFVVVVVVVVSNIYLSRNTKNITEEFYVVFMIALIKGLNRVLLAKNG